MPVIPNFTERFIVPRVSRSFGLLTGIFLDIVGTGAFKAAATAFRLGVFDVLSHGPLTAAGVASQIRANERGTRVLLEALGAFGYLRKKNGRYANAPLTTMWLLRSPPNILSNVTENFDSLVFEFWRTHLEGAVLNGKPQTTFYEWLNQRPGGWEIFNSWEMATARTLGDTVIDKVRLPPNARRLLDLGGGHGLYSILFCRRHPGLSATVFDMPQPLKTAREMISSDGIENRVSLQPGDFWVDDLGGGYDIVLMFNIIHAYTPDRNIELLRKVARALNPKGLVVIWDQLAGKALGPLSRAINQFLGLNYLATLGGQVYSFKEVTGWLSAAGFTSPRWIRPKALGLVVSNRV